MKPGRELDCLVDREVFKHDSEIVASGEAVRLGPVRPDGNQPALESVPHYSTYMEDSELVAEKIGLYKKSKRLELKQFGKSWNVLKLHKYDIDYISTGESGPHALCLAALKAVGYSK